MANMSRRGGRRAGPCLGPIVAMGMALGGCAVQAQPAQTSAPAVAAERMNVIFILSDDHRYDMMGFHPGAPAWLQTPHMDRMAREGAHVANAFVTTSLCSPSRATILTGQYAHRHGVVDNQTPVPEGTRFYPQYLQQNGYSTALVGKWHMGHHEDDPRPGFDHWVSFRGQGPYYDPLLNVNGTRVQHRGYTADILTDYALDWLEEQRRVGRPFFLHLAHKNVHAEFAPAERHLHRYEQVELRYPETMSPNAPGVETWPRWVLEQRNSWHGVEWMYHGRITFNDFFRRYAEALLAVDESIGRVLDYLQETGLHENSLVIYMGDNGFSFGEHGLIDKRHAFEESMRVPMLVWAPGLVRPGMAVRQNVVNTDIMPTVLELTGTRAPAGHAVDGQSFVPLLRGEAAPNWRDTVYYEYYWEWNYPQTPTQFALRTDRFKYIFFHGTWDTAALFDLQEDPQEKYNLVERPEYQERVVQMRNQLFDLMQETGGMELPLRRPSGEHNVQRRPPGAAPMDPLTPPGVD
jgi:N-acetylglucosamine-6-sulfatase